MSNKFTAAGTFAYSFSISSNNSDMEMMFEPNNRYDSNAVVLLLNKQKIGYIPKNLNKSINPSTAIINDWTARVDHKIEFIITVSYIQEKEEDAKEKEKEEDKQKR